MGGARGGRHVRPRRRRRPVRDCSHPARLSRCACCKAALLVQYRHSRHHVRARRARLAQRQSHALGDETRSLADCLTAMRLKQDEKQEEDLEALLRRDVRARLPLVRQFLLYLDPFALFKDASRGRERALSYNRDLRWILLHYLRRWSCIAATLFLAIAPTESLAAQSPV